MRHNHDIGQQQPPKSTSKDAATYFSIAETGRCLTDTPVSLAEVAGYIQSPPTKLGKIQIFLSTKNFFILMI
jgi:hypothetical protein